MELEKHSLETTAEPEVLAARIDMTLNHDRLDEITKIKNPSLVVGTRDDATVPYYFFEDLQEAIEGSELVIVEEGGHYSCAITRKSGPGSWGPSWRSGKTRSDTCRHRRHRLVVGCPGRGDRKTDKLELRAGYTRLADKNAKFAETFN